MTIADTGPGISVNRSLRRHRLSRNVAVHQFHRIGRREWECPGQHLVQHDAQRVKITPRINRAIHSPGLFRRHVPEAFRR